MRLSETMPDGASLKDHLLLIHKNTGKKPKELENLIELPPEFTKVWEDFINLSSSRQSGFGISPLSYTEIKNYGDLMGIEFEPWEVNMIKLFDRVTVAEVNKQQEKKAKSK